MPVGNDIIDLNRHSAQHRHTDERFIQKILHTTEIELLQQSTNQPYFLWMLWTIKEAAYKYCKQVNADFIFSPKKIFIETTQFENNLVLLQNDELLFRNNFNNTLKHIVNTPLMSLTCYSVFSKNFIHTVAINNEATINWGIKKIENNQSATQSNEARAFALSSFNNTNAQLNFNDKIPVIFLNEKQYATSLSHDGFYVSFAIEI